MRVSYSRPKYCWYSFYRYSLNIDICVFYLELLMKFIIAFAVDKCAKCDSHARCDNGNCICMEGWVGDGLSCSPKEGPGRKYFTLSLTFLISIACFLTLHKRPKIGDGLRE